MNLFYLSLFQETKHKGRANLGVKKQKKKHRTCNACRYYLNDHSTCAGVSEITQLAAILNKPVLLSVVCLLSGILKFLSYIRYYLHLHRNIRQELFSINRNLSLPEEGILNCSFNLGQRVYEDKKKGCRRLLRAENQLVESFTMLETQKKQ